MGEVHWLRAIGFGSHDEDDFDRLWRQPITEAADGATVERGRCFFGAGGNGTFGFLVRGEGAPWDS